jgi:uncharacterized protein
MQQHSPLDFTSLLHALSRPQAFPFVCSEQEISLIQTHASAVLLTSGLVYKVKKPKNFGFFDYSTPALRRFFCQQEVRLNAPLAPTIYLGIAPILYTTHGQIRMGTTCSCENIPEPGALQEGERVIDYAVVMIRLPDTATLESMVLAGTATPSLLAEIARHIAKFHAATSTSEYISSFGSCDCMQKNWQENFVQMQPYRGRTIDARSDELITRYVRQFIEGRTALFASRVNEQRIRDGHGDMRLQHIYILNSILDQASESDLRHPRIVLLDRIEFNERFRYSDVASEVAFLVMELDAAGRTDLSRAFVDAYIAETGDEALREVLPFYCCYRAYVRGKVSSFQLDEPEIPATQRQAASQAATSLFALATHYASGSAKPTALLVGGLMGTGKSTLALALQHETGWKSFSSDVVRKQLAHVDSLQPQASRFNQGIYTAQWTEHTYAALCDRAKNELAHGHSVLIDASFLRRMDRQAMVRLARRYDARILFVECLCPQEVVLQRLAQRWEKRNAGRASSLSDGRPELYEEQRSRWEVFDGEQESPLGHIAVSTTDPLAGSLEQVLEVLELPHLACWLPEAVDLP